MLPSDFPPWQTVYWWFRRFVRRLLFNTIHDIALMVDRERAGREASPSAAVIDSQSVKAPSAKARGYDAAKKIVGRKRHIAVDTDGRLLMVNLTTADIADSAGAQRFSTPSASAGPGSSISSPTAPMIAESSWTRPPFSTSSSKSSAGSTRPRLPRSAPAVGRRTNLRMDDALATPGARLRAAPRRLRGNDPRRPRLPPPPAYRSLNDILKRTLRSSVTRRLWASIEGKPLRAVKNENTLLSG